MKQTFIRSMMLTGTLFFSVAAHARAVTRFLCVGSDGNLHTVVENYYAEGPFQGKAAHFVHPYETSYQNVAPSPVSKVIPETVPIVYRGDHGLPEINIFPGETTTPSGTGTLRAIDSAGHTVTYTLYNCAKSEVGLPDGHPF